MIACTNAHGFEEGENCESTISMEHTLGSDINLFRYYMILLGYDMILFGSCFKFQDLSVMLESALINFGVKNQVPKISFKIYARDLMLVFSHEFADIIFCESLDILEVYQIMELEHSLSMIPGILYLST